MYKQNILCLLLELLGVKHTKGYALQYYETHPHKNDLLGLSRMLTYYGIENEGVRLEKDKESIYEIQRPFVAYWDQSFVVITEIKNDKILYHLDGIKKMIPLDDFFGKWNGIALLIEKNANSIEPNYIQNKQREWFHMLMKYLFGLSVLFIPIFSFIQNLRVQNTDWVFLVLNLCGCYIAYLLILKQLNVDAPYANKICSILGSKNDCKNALNSSASKLFDTISLSEIGLGYFITNIFIMSIFPYWYHSLILINMCSLPFTLWSIWYQKVKLRQWCPLCLLIQLLLWLIFINSCFHGISFMHINIWNLIFIGCFYIISILLIYKIDSSYELKRRNTELLYNLNNIKADKTVFRTLQEQQPCYSINRDMGILLGDKDAQTLITIVTNPYCGPCAQLHKRLDKILRQKNYSHVTIQLIVMAFTDNAKKISKLFIAMYKQLSEEDFLLFLRKWYEMSSENRELIYKDYIFDENDKQIEHELTQQQEWLWSAKIFATPTILYNGYILSEKYTLEDIVRLDN